MTDYLDNGFNKQLEKNAPPSDEEAEADAEIYSPSFGQGQPGYLTSLTGKYKFDLVGDRLSYNDGRKERLLVPSPQYIVATDGTGDFGDIQEAIDFVNTIGGGTILIRAGTYTPLSPLKLKSNVNLIGEGIRNTIVDFYKVGVFLNSAAFEAFGTLINTSGSITFTNGSAVVTGSGTTFNQSAAAGDSIYIFGVPYEIKSIASATSLTLVSTYRGTGGVNIGYSIGRSIKNCQISGITFKNASASGLSLNLAETIEISSNEFTNFTGNIQYAGIKVANCYNTLIFQNYIHDNQRGILFNNILYSTGVTQNATNVTKFSCKVIENEIYNNVKDGLRAELAADLIINSNSCKSNGGSGIYLRMSENINVVANICNSNVANGITLRSYDGGPQMGIGHDCLNISVVSNICELNSTHGIHVRASGSASAIADPMVYFPMYLKINANTINSNTTHGILLDGFTEGIGDDAETS